MRRLIFPSKEELETVYGVGWCRAQISYVGVFHVTVDKLLGDMSVHQERFRIRVKDRMIAKSLKGKAVHLGDFFTPVARIVRDWPWGENP